ncbi:hypothetical protein ABGB07_39845 [Micromonosporaceae bacterium B7E4]
MNIWQRLLAWRRIRRAARELIRRRDVEGRFSLPGYRAALRYIETGDVKDFIQEKPHGRWRRVGGWR